MELLEFKNKILSLCEVQEIKDIGEVLMRVVLNNETAFFDKYNGIIDEAKIGYKRYGNITKPIERKRNKTTHRKAFAS